MSSIAVDHFPGAVIYIVEFGSHKIIIGWDMKSLPSPVDNPQLQRPSLAMVEANTWSALSHRTGHTSVEELVSSGFLRELRAAEGMSERYGIYLVHYGGSEDPDGAMTDRELASRFRRRYPEYATWVDVASRGQIWRFEVAA